MRVDKCNELLTTRQYPENEVRIESVPGMRVKQANASALGKVAKEENLFTLESTLALRPEGGDEFVLAAIEQWWGRCRHPLVVRKQRLVNVSVEVDRRNVLMLALVESVALYQ